MKAFRIFLLIVVALALSAAVSGVQRVRVSSSDGLQLFQFSTVWARVVTGLIGLVLFALAARRISLRLWYAGATVLLLTAGGLLVQGIVASLAATDVFTRAWAAASQIAAAVIVTAVFLKWWLPKRKRFMPPNAY